MTTPDFKEQIIGVEAEFLLCGKKGASDKTSRTLCEIILDDIQNRLNTIPFEGKGGGFLVCIADRLGKNPLLFRIQGDGRLYSQNHVLECSLPETNAVSAVKMMNDYIYPFLGCLEAQINSDDREIHFLASTHDLHGHRAAYHFNASIWNSRCTAELYPSLAPLHATLPCVTGPGGLTPCGYVRSVRMSCHSKTFISPSIDRSPMCYPRSNNYGSLLRSHINIDHCRLPGAQLFNLSTLALVHYAYQVAPERFTLRLENPAGAAKKLSGSLDNTAEVPVCSADGGKKMLTGIAIQGRMLDVTESVIRDFGGPEWALQAFWFWKRALREVSRGGGENFSDFQLKKQHINKCLGRVGLRIEDSIAQSAFARISSMLHRQVDLDDFFSGKKSPDATISLNAARRRARNGLAYSEMKEIYLKSLRDILVIETGFLRVGNSCLVSTLPAASDTLLLSTEHIYLAPRAQMRNNLIERYREDPRLAVSWENVYTTDEEICMGAPELYTEEHTPRTPNWIIEMSLYFSEIDADEDTLENETEWFEEVQQFVKEESVDTDAAVCSPGNPLPESEPEPCDMWAVQTDYIVHERVCALARDVVRNMEHSPLDLNEFTPVVFFFKDKPRGQEKVVRSSNRALRELQLAGRFPASSERLDRIYSICNVTSDYKVFFQRRMKIQTLSARAFLNTSRVMELERYASAAERPVQYQCRVAPDEDAELSSFSQAERLVAWGAKYAENTVIVAAHEGWRPSGMLKDFLRCRSVMLHTVPLSIIPPDDLYLMQHIHFIAAEFKKKADAEELVDRIIAKMHKQQKAGLLERH